MRLLLRRGYRFVSFLGVGALSAAVDASVFAGAFAAGLAAPAASACGFVCAFVINYSGNRLLVFRVRRSAAALRRYVVLVVANLAVTTALVAGLVHVGTNAYVAKGISMALIACLNFVVMRGWVFRGVIAAGGRDDVRPADTDRAG